jgi:hypothetical protein
MRVFLARPQIAMRFTLLGILLAAAVWVLPVPAHAYEEDTHFTLTYVLCRAAGFADDEAVIVAGYDQGLDDSPGTVANGGLGGLIPNQEEEHLWHAIPRKGTAAEVLKRKGELWAQVLSERDPTNQLKRLGVFFHYQQDSWAHRYHPNSSATRFTPYRVPFGHAIHGHQPDRPPFDPVCALRCLEEGVTYACMYLRTALRRTPNPLFKNYQPALGSEDSRWKDSRNGRYFHQLARDRSTPGRDFLTDLVCSQIDAYTSSLDPNPSFAGRFTADEAQHTRVCARLQDACNRARTGIIVPLSRTKITTLTTPQLGVPNLGTRAYTIRIFTGNKLWAGTDSNIYMSMRGSDGVIGEQCLNPLISGNAFERNQTDTAVLAGLAAIGEVQSITIRSDGSWPSSDWYLGWVEISAPGISTRRFVLNDWLQKDKLIRTLSRQ